MERKEKTIRPFGFLDKFSYLLGDAGCNMSFSLISGYMFIFYTQYIGVSLVHYGLIILFTKIWDGINDPIIGAIADRFNPKGGDKFRPWIFWGSFPLAFSACLLFLDTSTAPYWMKIAVCIIGYLIWDVAYTIVNVPYGSLNSTITANSIERSQLSTWRTFGAMVTAMPLMIILPQILYKKTEIDGVVVSELQGQKMFTVALVLGILALICFQALYRLSVERIKHKEHDGEKFNYFKTLKGFFTNRTMLAVSLAALVQIVFMSSTQTTGALVYQMYFGNGKLSSLGVISILPMILVGPLVKPLVKRFGKKAICTWPLLIGVVVNIFLILTSQVSVTLWIVCQLFIAFSMGAYALVGWALVSDGIDSIEIETGRREEGSAYATYSMLRKIGQGLGQSLIPFLIAITIPGLNMNDNATWSVSYGLQIKNLSVGLSLIGYILAFLILYFVYDIDKKREQEIPQLLGRVVDENINTKDELAGQVSRRDS